MKAATKRLLETTCLNSEVKAAFNVNTATVALLPGHTTSKYVNDIYRRHRPRTNPKLLANYQGWKYFLIF